MTLRHVGATLGLAVPLLASVVAPEPSLLDRVTARLAERESALVAIRRDLHRHPEVSLEEERTAGVVAARLRELGLEVRTGVGGHGVVGILRGGRPGPLVAYRADMDAVPSTAPDPVEFRSVVPGVRHLCGHDIHTTIGLALAEGLSAVRTELPGTILFLFQPAEERVVGAQAMLDAGVFDGDRPAAILALHTAPLPVGQLGTMSGTMMAWRDQVEITIRGTGDLAAAADSVTGILRAASTVTAAQAMTPMAPGFRFVQVFPRAGSLRTVGGSVSSATDEASDRARREIREGLDRLSLPGLSFDLAYRSRAVPGVINDSTLTRVTSRAIRAVLGDSAVVALGLISPLFSEDYGAFERLVPGGFYYLGVGPIGMPHSPGYVADEAAILVGAKAMAAALLARLGAA